MGNHYTRIVRIYPRNKKDKIPVTQICKSIQGSAHFENELIWNLNEEEGHLDLKWNAKRGGGDLGIEYQDYEVWEIDSDQKNQIIHNKKFSSNADYNGLFLFAFDQIRIKNTNKVLQEEYFKFIDYLKPKGRVTEYGQELCVDLSGCYYSDCSYEIGEFVPYKNPIREVSLKEFLEPRGEITGIDDILCNDLGAPSLNKFISFIYSEHDPEDIDLFKGFEHVQFLYNNRIVNEIIKTDNPYEIWQCKNSDWWDNCIYPDWIAFITKWENGL